MGTTYRYISDPSAPDSAVKWFRQLPDGPDLITPEPRASWLYFRTLGTLVYGEDGKVDAKRSPVATIFPPRVRRGILWTIGEVHFLPTPLRETFPALDKISRTFKKWLETFPCVYRNGEQNEWDYYLEAGSQGIDVAIYALEGGLDALKAGRYFVPEDATETVLDKLCSTLRLREVYCLKDT